MAKMKLKRISVNAFEKAVVDTYVPFENFEWNGIDVLVKKTLPLKEMLEFIDGVTKSCFNEDTNAYRPEVKEFAIKIFVLEKYANFTMPKNIESKYDLIYQSDIVSCVLKYINMEQYNEIITAINQKVNNLAQANIEAVNIQMNNLYNAFDNLQSNLDTMFAGVNPDELKNAIGYISNGQVFGDDKVLELYSKTVSDSEGGDNN